MSLAIVKARLHEFLAAAEPEVLVLRGDWGIGKTHTWNTCLQEASTNGSLGLDSYAYVSLFGVSTLDDLRYMIFQETVDKSNIADGPSEATVHENVARLGASWTKRIAGWFHGAPLLSNWAPALRAFAFFQTRDQLVCLDDFERKGDGLDPRDILGLVSLLKEQKNCKIVLILNPDSFDPSSKTNYQTYREKVVDTELEFDPTPRDCASLLLSKDVQRERVLMENCIALGIKNIRIIRRTKQLAEKVVPLLEDYDEKVFKQALHTLPLLAWSFYGPKGEVPDLNSLTTEDGEIAELFREEELPEDDKRWKALLNEYGYRYSDEFDNVLGRYIEAGYIDEERLHECAMELHARYTNEEAVRIIGEAWNTFRGTFENNESEVIEKIDEAFRKYPDQVSLSDIDRAIGLFRKLGHDRRADDLCEFFEREYPKVFEKYNPDIVHIVGDLTDARLKKLVEEAQERGRTYRSLSEVLLHIGKREGWNPEDEVVLEKATVDDFYQVFKELTNDELWTCVRAALDFRKIAGAKDVLLQSTDKAEEALRKIGRESKVNRIRVENLGISIDSPVADSGEEPNKE